ncbi:MAG: hypothetical protein WBF80_03370, partial [Rhodococcus sp. (in: high G+C Gram-positive bacteria)]
GSADRFASARSEVVAAQTNSNAMARAYNRVLLALLANVILRLGVSFEVYRSIGISSARGAFASRRRRSEIRRRDAASTVAFLDSAGMLDGTLTSALWRLTGVGPDEQNAEVRT